MDDIRIACIIAEEIRWTNEALSEENHNLTDFEKSCLAFHKMRMEKIMEEIDGNS